MTITADTGDKGEYEEEGGTAVPKAPGSAYSALRSLCSEISALTVPLVEISYSDTLE